MATVIGADGRSYIARAEADRLQAERRRWLDRTAASRRLGISEDSLDHFVALGLVVGADRAVIGRAGFWLDGTRIDELLSDLSRDLPTCKGRGWLKPTAAVQALSTSGFNLADLVRAVLDKRVRASWFAQGTRGVSSLRIAREDIRDRVLATRRERVRTKGYSQPRVAEQLRVRASQVRYWIERGALQTQADGSVAHDQLLAFKRAYGPCQEVARSSGVPSFRIRAWIRQGAVRAISGPDVDGSRTFWVARADFRNAPAS